MSNISVRKIDEETHTILQSMAQEQGISMEELVRRILKDVTSRPANIGTFFLKCFGAENGIELEIPSRQTHEPIDLG